MPPVTLPQSTDVKQIGIRRDPGVTIPSPGPSGLRELGSAISQVGAQFQAANDARVLSNLEANTATKLNDFRIELESDPDSFEEWEGKFKEFSKTHLEEVQKSGVNRTVYDAWARSFTPMQERSRVRILGRARETMVDKGLTELKSNLEAVQGLAITSNKDDRDLYVSQADLMIERAQDTGYIKDSTAQGLRDGFRGGTDRARFENALTVDPQLAKEALEAGDFDVSEADRPAWVKAADNAISAQERQARLEEDRAKKRAKEEQKIIQEQTEVDFVGRLDGEAPPTLMEINNSPLDANHKLQWRTLLASSAKKKIEGDPLVYSDLTVAVNGDGMYEGEPVTKDTILMHVRGEALTPQQGEHLMDRWEKRNKPATEKDAATENDVKLAVGVLANLRENGMFAVGATENSLAHARAVDGLVNWAAANPDGDPIKYVEDTLVPKVEEGFWTGIWSDISSLVSASDSDILKRNDAIDYLARNSKPVTEDNIQRTMEYLSGR